MERRDGPVLTQRERRTLAFIEEQLRGQDEALDLALRSMRPRRRRWLPRRRSSACGDGGEAGGAGGEAVAGG
ncbi:DUF3040 domain-containing protein [Streptacidiphilus jiangxiensis]|uniref:Uncharacterized protein n=1 Tax=Streptacidiphilus jiangxiensis TaxID=235985 RepID=A0A1H7V4U5_STRJI|nr:DUF3040 domain-containing protein [Streptacidiphilus jiangxiensis]SEM03835.1 Protein of unknown function [Streptacidiphilus jiangxiensis]